LLAGALFVVLHVVLQWSTLFVPEGMAWVVAVTGLSWVCSAVLYDAALYACAVWSCAAAVVLTLTSSTAGRGTQAHVWPLRTWCCDLSDVPDARCAVAILRHHLNGKGGHVEFSGVSPGWFHTTQRREWLRDLRLLASMGWYLLFVVPLAVFVIFG
jgi:hypothetical protein